MNIISQAPQRIRHETRRRQLHVLRTEAVSPRMRRIVFGGAALDGFISAAAETT